MRAAAVFLAQESPREGDVEVRVLLADDNHDIRAALVELIDQAEGLRVVAACSDGDEVLEAARRTRPDVVLLDLSMPRRSGLAAARDVREALQDARVVILTGSLDPASVLEAHALGAVGYLLKGDDPDALAEQLRTVARGGAAWGPEASRVLRAAGA